MGLTLLSVTFEYDGISYQVEITSHIGAGTVFYVYINKYYCGQVVPAPNGWIADIKNCVLTGDDIHAMLDSINELYPQQFNIQ